MLMFHSVGCYGLHYLLKILGLGFAFSLGFFMGLYYV